MILLPAIIKWCGYTNYVC